MNTVVAGMQAVSMPMDHHPAAGARQARQAHQSHGKAQV